MSFEGNTTATDAATEAHATALKVLSEVLGDGLKTVAFRDNLRVYVTPGQLIEVLTALRDRAGLNSLIELGGADYLKYPGRTGPRFEVHYVVRNFDTSETLIVKVGVDDPDPSIPTATALWAGADWMEREVFDMFGVTFTGHPDLRRILMPEGFTAFPLRKDYPLRGRGERHNFPRLTRGQS